MERYKVVALIPVRLSVEFDREAPPQHVELNEGEVLIAGRVLRIIPPGEFPPVNIVAHPSSPGESVRVSDYVQIEQLVSERQDHGSSPP